MGKVTRLATAWVDTKGRTIYAEFPPLETFTSSDRDITVRGNQEHKYGASRFVILDKRGRVCGTSRTPDGLIRSKHA